MKNIKPPKRRAILDYDGVVSRKKAGAEKHWLGSKRTDIASRYAVYQRHKKSLESVPLLPWPVNEAEMLRKCYDNSQFFRDQLLRRSHPNHLSQTVQCPYCQVDPARTWDHFLPYSSYPEFSVYAQNLIRACDECNRTKNKYGVGTPRRVFNPYYDLTQNVRYLACDLRIHRGQLTALYLVRPDIAAPGYSLALHTLVRQHFELFGLEQKLRAQAGSEISSFLASARQFGRPNVVDVRQALANWILDASASQIGINDREWLWREALRTFPTLNQLL